MPDLSIFHDPTGHTLTVWFGAPQSEYICEETGDEVVLMKDRDGQVIGFERLNYEPGSKLPIALEFETLPGAA